MDDAPVAAERTDRLAPGEDARRWRDAKRVLVLQGGGALGSYQAGVYEGLADEGESLDWVAGISIGAINAAIIAGNPPERRVERLRAFWETATSGLVPAPPLPGDGPRTVFNSLSAAMITVFGAPGFFAPRITPAWLAAPGSAEALGLYDTTPLHDTLERLVDFDRINHPGSTRLTVGAVEVESGDSVIFDSRRMKLGPEHVMASGALPPGLPPVEIEGRLYWDGGLVSNTPLQFVLDDEVDEDVLVLQLDLFDARGPRPQTLKDLDAREKDIRFSSRTRMNTAMMRDQHKAKQAMRALLAALPPDFAGREDVAVLKAQSRENAVCIVQLIYRKRSYEGGSSDYEFSRQSMLDHWGAGAADIAAARPQLVAMLDRPREPGMMTLDPGRADPAPPFPEAPTEPGQETER